MTRGDIIRNIVYGTLSTVLWVAIGIVAYAPCKTFFLFIWNSGENPIKSTALIIVVGYFGLIALLIIAGGGR